MTCINLDPTTPAPALSFSFEDGRFCFTDARGAGWRGLLFELNGTLSTALACRSQDLTDQGGGVVLDGPAHTERLTFTVDAATQALTVKRVIENTGAQPLRFESVADGLLDTEGEIGLAVPAGAIDHYKLRYFHTSNVKIEKFPRFRVEHPYVRCIPYDTVHFNHDEANAYPAFGVCDRDYQTVLVEGDLNQLRFERSWELGMEGANRKSLPSVYRGLQRYTLSDGFVLPAGESVEVSRVYYQIRQDSHPQTAFEDYADALASQHSFRGPKTRILNEGVYCTWNYGGYADIDEQNILLRARTLAENIPGCTHFLIDDGYQAKRNDRNAGIDSFYPVPREGYDKAKFPRGMKVIADEIREMGLKPCIWLAPKVYLDSDLAAENPDWLQKNADGSPDLIDGTSFLDLAHPEARAFYLEVLDALLVDWGYEGIKYDFMTQWFLMESSRFADGSGLEWQNFAFSEIRKRIGDDGFFMTCIAFSAGNPFPGLNADCYRCGFDIHDGTWPEQVRASSGTLPAVLVEGRKSLLLNMDSAGFSDIPANEQRFRFTWCFITQGLLEIGGLLENHRPEQFAMFNRLLANADRGHKVTCLDDRALTGEPLPEALQVRYPADSRMAAAGVQQHLAFFNWSNDRKLISVPLAKAGLAAGETLTDFWTDHRLTTQGDYLSIDLPAHSAALYTQTQS